jgi:hypothetical protein
MRRSVVIIGIILVGAIVGFSVLFWFIQNRPVRFELEGEGYSVAVYNEDDSVINTVTASGTIRLSEGEYSYSVNGETFDNTKIAFSVEGQDTEVVVRPSLSNSRLSELLSAERERIEVALNNRYSSVPYTIIGLSLYEEGDWAAGTLQPTVDPRQLPDTYRFVLKKEGSEWIVVVPPRIAILQTEFPDVPREILYSLYTSN